MIYSEEYKEHIEYTFAAFCRVVLHNAAMTVYRDLGRKRKREVSLEYLISETPFEPFTTDTYFEQYDQPTVFVIKGQEIVVANKQLADALLKLSEQRRNVLFLYFFFGYTDAQIGKEYGRNRSTANYWKLAALKQLRKEMERLEYEEQEADTFEVIEKAVAGEPEAIELVLQHYSPRIKYLSKYKGNFNSDIQDRLQVQLMKAIIQFRFDK